MATIKTKKDYYKENKYFVPSQPNPTEVIGKGKKGDCVIRAFCHAFGYEWQEAFDTLCERGRRTYDTPNGQQNYLGWLEEHGYTSVTTKAVKGKKRMTTEDLAKNNPSGVFIVKNANHLTSVIDGKIYDSWNTANQCVYRYWKIR